MDNYAEFQDGADYDAQYGALYEPEIAFFKDWVRERGGPVLDVCCGTGIVSVPLAATGVEVVGIDLSEAMLQQARRKTLAESNPTWLQGDVLEMSLGRTFELVTMTGYAFQEFLTPASILRLFQRVEAHLTPGGCFVFDTRNPAIYDFAERRDFEQWDHYVDPQGRDTRVLGRQDYSPEEKVVTFNLKREPQEGESRATSLRVRFTDLAELRGLTEEAGLQLHTVFADWEKTPLQEASPAFVCAASKA